MSAAVRVLKETLKGVLYDVEVILPDDSMYLVKVNKNANGIRAYSVKRYHSEGSKLTLKSVGSTKRYQEVTAAAIALITRIAFG